MVFASTGGKSDEAAKAVRSTGASDPNHSLSCSRPKTSTKTWPLKGQTPGETVRKIDRHFFQPHSRVVRGLRFSFARAEILFSILRDSHRTYRTDTSDIA
jgi:hypothetical protein